MVRLKNYSFDVLDCHSTEIEAIRSDACIGTAILMMSGKFQRMTGICGFCIRLQIVQDGDFFNFFHELRH